MGGKSSKQAPECGTTGEDNPRSSTCPHPPVDLTEWHRAAAVRTLIANDASCFTGSDDHTVKHWEMSTGECIWAFEGHTGSVNCLVRTRTEIITGSADGSVQVWNIETGSCVHTFHLGSPVNAVALIPEECESLHQNTAFFACDDGSLRQYSLDPESHSEMMSIEVGAQLHLTAAATTTTAVYVAAHDGSLRNYVLPTIENAPAECAFLVESVDAPDGISSITILCGTAYNAATQASELVITSRNTATGGKVDVWSGSQCVQKIAGGILTSVAGTWSSVLCVAHFDDSVTLWAEPKPGTEDAPLVQLQQIPGGSGYISAISGSATACAVVRQRGWLDSQDGKQKLFIVEKDLLKHRRAVSKLPEGPEKDASREQLRRREKEVQLLDAQLSAPIRNQHWIDMITLPEVSRPSMRHKSYSARKAMGMSHGLSNN